MTAEGHRGVRILVDCTITSHMSSAAANPTNNISSEVPLFGTIVFAMANATTILTDLIFIVTECTVECCKFSKLVPFMIVLPFGGRSSLNYILVEISDRNE